MQQKKVPISRPCNGASSNFLKFTEDVSREVNKKHTHGVVVEHDYRRFVFSVVNCAPSDRLSGGDEEHVLAGS
jgi:hypothetical protein